MGRVVGLVIETEELIEESPEGDEPKPPNGEKTKQAEGDEPKPPNGEKTKQAEGDGPKPPKVKG